MTEENEEQHEEQEEHNETAELAKHEGHISLEEWESKGKDLKLWKSPEQFVEDGEKINGVLKKRIDTLESDNRQLGEDVRNFMTHQQRQTKKQLEEQHQRLTDDYNGQLAEVQRLKDVAAEDDDLPAYQAADKLGRGLVKPQDVEAEIAGQPGFNATEQQRIAREIGMWVSNGNQWYDDDPELRQYADKVAAGNAAIGVKFTLDDIAKEVKSRYPGKFGNANRDNPNLVGGGNRLGKGKKKGYTDLPSDAKQACDRFVRKGVMKKEDYVKSYFGDN